MRLLLTLSITLLLYQGVHAQAGIHVQVLDISDGEVMSGIDVTLQNPEIGIEKVSRTNDQGMVYFSELGILGEYQLHIPESDLYYPLTASGITLRRNNTRSINMLLTHKESISLDQITVRPRYSIARVNTINAEVSSELVEDELNVLPIEGRDITRALYRLPNVTQSTGFYPEAPNVSVNGANSLYTSYLIDGMDNTERFLGGTRFRIPVGFTSNVTVLANNFSAEYGQSSNGIIDVTTQSGSNQIEGDLYYEVRPGPVIDSSSPFNQTDLSGNQVGDGFQRHQFGLSLGGPIRKDQTFFYLNTEQTYSLKENLLNVPELKVNHAIPGDNSYTLLSGKIDHYWNDRFRSSLRIHRGLVHIDRQGGGIEGGTTFPEAGNRQRRNSFTAAISNTFQGHRFNLETNYQYSSFHWLYTDPLTTDAPSVFAEDPQGKTIAILGQAFGTFDILQDVHELQQKVTFERGPHLFKFGGSLLGSFHRDTRGGNPNGLYRVALNSQQLQDLRDQGTGADLSYRDLPSDVDVLSNQVELHPNQFEGHQLLLGLYAEDQLSVSNNLTLTFGLRFDYDNLSKAGSRHGDWNNIAPRLNVNYQLDEYSTIRSGYGIFYDRIPYTIYSDAIAGSSTSPDFLEQVKLLRNQGYLPENTDVDRVTYDGNASVFETDVTYLNGSIRENFLVSDGFAFSNQKTLLNPEGLDNPYAHHVSLGYQRQIKEDVLFYIDLLHKRGYNQFRLVDVNTPEPFQGLSPESGPEDVRTLEEADRTRRVPIHIDGDGHPFALSGPDTLRNVARRITMTDTGGESRYWAMNLNLLKSRNSDKYSYRISYTLSYLRNNTEDINFEAEDANRFENEWGPSINDRRHVIQTIGSYYPLDLLSITLTSLIQSGQPVNRIADASNFGGTTDLNGDGTSRAVQYTGKTDRAPGASRNDRRLPWSTTFDIGISYQLPIMDRRLHLRADIFNLFNTTNYSGYTSNATASNQIQVGLIERENFVYRNAAPPRQFQFSLNYTF